MASNILVLGAGELGTSILTSLTKRAPLSTKISVLLRPSTLSNTSLAGSQTAPLKTLSDLNISFVPGDVTTNSVSELAEIFSSYDLVISALGMSNALGTQVKITKAVLHAGVRRYIPWQFGVDYEVVGRGSGQDVWDEQLDVRELLKSQDGKKTEWIIVSTGIFMSFLFEGSFGVVDMNDVKRRDDENKGVVRALGSWDNQVTVTTPEDIGRLTAEIIFAKERIGNEVVYIAGETIRYGRLAAVVDAVLERKLRREVWTVDYLKKELDKDPDNVMKKYRLVFAKGTGVYWDMAKTFNMKKGLNTTRVEEYAKGRLDSSA